MASRKIKILDTTLRDGEQTSGVSFTETEKLSLARYLIEDVKVDRLEIASARVSEGERQSALKIIQWAKQQGHLDKIEILGFVDGVASVDWIKQVGGTRINLLAKGSLKHVKGQLGKNPDQHLSDIKNAVSYARKNDIGVNLYLEDWSNGMRDSRDYIYYLIDELQDEPIDRFMLPDTLGVLNPSETYDFCYQMKIRYPQLHFDFHAHNDYDLAIGNVMEAAKAGIDCFHTTVNGLGERAGNAVLSSVVAVLKDHLHLDLGIDESKMHKISNLVASFSGLRVPANKPVIGELVFTQTCGVHADGDSKDNLYVNALFPERFGRTRRYALGKTSGKANIKKNLEELGMELDETSLKRVTERVIELGDKKEQVTMEDLPYIVSDVLEWETIPTSVKIENYSLSHVKGLKPVASLALSIDSKMYEANAAGDGQYDAFMNALKSIYQKTDKRLPQLTDYAVSIPPGGKTDAIVETTITWELDREFKTRGIDTDQTFAAIKATEKMLNIIEMPKKATFAELTHKTH